MFFSEEKKGIFTHAHFQYSSAGSLARFRILVMTDEVSELSHKKILLVTGCGHRNHVYLSMLITWMSGRGAPVERNH